MTPGTRNSEGEVGPVEAGGHAKRLAQLQPGDHVGRHARRGGGGGRDYRAGPERPGSVGEAEVVGPEVVPPLRDAVGLVDHEQADPRGAHPLEEAGGGEPLGGHVEEPQLARQGPLQGRGVGARVLLCVDQRHTLAEAAGAQRLHLVLHERHQRRDHDREVVTQEAGKLVAERLARPGGHDHEHVPARQRRLAGLALPGPELGEAEELVQRSGQVHGGGPP